MKNGMVKLGDFNVSIVLKKGMMCHEQEGTPYYASPEVWRDEEYNSKSDVWALGCILYELIHLKPPFRARDMEGLFKKVNRGYYGKIDKDYSEDFAVIIGYMLELNPFERKSCSKTFSIIE